MTAAPEGETSSDYDDALPGAQTELAPSSSATEMHTAWALDDSPEWRAPFWTAGRITAVAVAGAVVLLAVAAIVGVVKLRHDEEARPVAETPTSVVAMPPPPPVTVTTVVIEKPPATVTQTAPPQVVMPTKRSASTKRLQVADEEFIDRLRGNGWVIIDADLLKTQGRQICEEYTVLGNPQSVVEGKLMGAGYSRVDAETMAFVAQISYPECVPAG